MVIKALDLFSAYRSGTLPAAGGHILSSFTADGSPIARFEVVAYRDARNMDLSPSGLTVHGAAAKAFILVEPADHPEREVEPFRRDPRTRIPHRLSELTIITARDEHRVLVSAEPVTISSPFTVPHPAGTDFAFCFFQRAGALDAIHQFLAATLREECQLPPVAARQAATAVRTCLGRCGD